MEGLCSPGIFAVGVGAGEDVAPQLLGNSARLAVGALTLGSLALRAVAQKEQPPLLLRDILLLVPVVLHLRHARVHVRVAACKQTSSA